MEDLQIRVTAESELADVSAVVDNILVVDESSFPVGACYEHLLYAQFQLAEV